VSSTKGGGESSTKGGTYVGGAILPHGNLGPSLLSHHRRDMKKVQKAHLRFAQHNLQWMIAVLQILIQSHPYLFGRFRTRMFGTGSEATKIDIFLPFFVLKSFLKTYK
jgi:hypothetical protein